MKFAASIMAVLIGILAVAFVNNYAGQKDTPSAAVESFYEFSLNGEIDKALELTAVSNNGAAPKPVSKQDENEQWAKMIQRNRDELVNVQKETIKDDEAKVYAAIEIGINSQRTIVYKLHKIDNQWKIVGYGSLSTDD